MDREELVMLLSEHYQYVRKKARTLISTDEAEDVANNAMINAFQALEDLRDPDNMKSWLKTIVENEAKAYYARRDKRKELDRLVNIEAAKGDLTELPEFAAGEAAFHEMMLRAETEYLAREIMDSLDPVNKSIMYMRFWGGYKFSEIGMILGIKDVTARSMYTRCRQRLCDRYGGIGKEAGPDDR